MARILVVDDSLTIRALLKRTLIQAGHEVVEAVDGGDGLLKLSEGKFELILSDINMPQMDGLAMIEQIRQNPQHARLPIFVISTEVRPEMKTKGKQIGVTAWMTKPPNPASLIDAITQVLSRSAPTG